MCFSTCRDLPIVPTPRPHFFSQTPESLEDLFRGWGLARFRATQVMDWVYRKGVADPRNMTNLGKNDIKILSENLTFLEGSVVRQQRATDGTRKLLIDWGLSDGGWQMADGGADESKVSGLPPQVALTVQGSAMAHSDSSHTFSASRLQPPTFNPKNQTECVMIPSDHDSSGRPRRTACISSQIGCPVGCAFCASGIGGLDGNLTTGQIVQQVWQLSFALPGEGREQGTGNSAPSHASALFPVPSALFPAQRITNVVFMGMGEPMANLRSVLPAIRTLAADWGVGLSARKITVSTVGVPQGIRKLADLDLPVTLAISLHAPNDELRRRIIPWAEFVTIQQLIDAGSDYFDKTGREITLEYILLGGVNDQPDHARELTQVARKLRSNINLIRYNEVKGMPFNRPHDEDVQRFQSILKKAGVNTHIRASRGRDIAAACGQLRHEKVTPV